MAAKYPDDVDATILAVEALMDLHPWNFYEFKTGEARPWTPEILALLEGALEAAPDHPMANHLYIHLTEASHEPERALPSAARLPKSAPGAGHLVHMPAHVYIRVGQYNEASKANQAAVEATRITSPNVGRRGSPTTRTTIISSRAPRRSTVAPSPWTPRIA